MTDDGEARYQVLDLVTGEVVGESAVRPPALSREETDLLAGVLAEIAAYDDLPEWERAAYESALSKLDSDAEVGES